LAKREYPKVVTIACVNFATVWGDKEANLKKIRRFTEQAAERGNDIVLFPELALSGYECGEDIAEGGCSMHRELAETIPGPSTEEIARTAKEKGIFRQRLSDPKEYWESIAKLTLCLRRQLRENASPLGVASPFLKPVWVLSVSRYAMIFGHFPCCQECLC